MQNVNSFKFYRNIPLNVVLLQLIERKVYCNGLTEWYPSQTLIYLHPNNCHEGILALNKLNKQYSNAATGNRTRAHCLQSERLVKDQKRTSPCGLWHQHSYTFVTITPSLDETRPRVLTLASTCPNTQTQSQMYHSIRSHRCHQTVTDWPNGTPPKP